MPEKPPMPLDQRMTATIPEFCQLSGLGESTVYKMIKEGRLDSFLVCKQRRLIVLDSYRRLIAEGVAADPLRKMG